MNSHTLLRWYRKNRRDLPWRRTRDSYRILVSEIMLQQTQVKTVIPYYHRFLKTFPSFASLARAPLGKVLKTWEGLGYYSRARNLQRLAQTVMKDPHGQLPNSLEGLLRLPGIGRYTAGAVASIAFNQDCAVVDGNVQRVLARYFAIDEDIGAPDTRAKLWELAESLVPSGQAGDYNQGLMELGAVVCTPQNPDCKVCPIHRGCQARQKNLQDQIPVKKKAKPIPHFDIGAGVVWKDDRILIDQRPLKGLLGGLWEFPGGKRRGKERLPECVRREIREELGIEIAVGARLAVVNHAYSHFKITLHVYTCRYRSGQPQALGCRAWQWVRVSDLKRLAFPAANQPIIQLLGTAQSVPAGRA